MNTNTTSLEDESQIYNILKNITDPESRYTLLTLYLQENAAAALKLHSAEVNIEKPLSVLGFDSITLIELKYIIDRDLKLNLPYEELLESPSIAELAEQILTGRPDYVEENAIQPAGNKSKSNSLQLSYGQKSLFFMQELAPAETAYNIARAFRITAGIDISRLKQAFQTLTDRHPQLRTCFPMVNGEPVQKIRDDFEVYFQWEDASQWDTEKLQQRLISEAHFKFQLQTGPLFRIHLFTRGENEHILSVVIHHIIADFWSLAILLKELGSLYAASGIEENSSLPAPLQYTDYVNWHNPFIEGTDGKPHWDYWKKELGGTLPVLNLPVDKPRPPIQTFNGAAHSFTLGKEACLDLEQLRYEHNVTLYTVLLAAYFVLLYRCSGQKDILIGSPVANRNRSELSQIVGFFVNTIVLRAIINGRESFTSLLDHVRMKVLAAFKHQEYPFSLLVEKLHPKRDPSRPPVFQTMFIYQQTPPLFERGSELQKQLSALALGNQHVRFDLNGFPLESVPLNLCEAQFDITLIAAELNGSINFTIQYNRDIYTAETITRLGEHYCNLLKAITAAPDQPLSQLLFLTDQEEYFIKQLNATGVDLSRDFIHEQIEARAQTTPNKIAIKFNNETYSYQELMQRVNKLACYLRSRGTAPETFAGIYMDRGPDMVIALLAVLKAEGAYIPLDPTHPTERTMYIIDDARINTLLTHSHILKKLHQYKGYSICLDTQWEQINAVQSVPLDSAGLHPLNLAYTIYTSGSTGKPKGVQIPHRAINNFLQAMQKQPGLTEDDTLLAVTTLSFDIAGLEILLPLTTGATVVIADSGTAADGDALAHLLKQSGATVMQAAPVTWKILLESGWEGESGLKILCGGEAFPAPLARRLLAKSAQVWNVYGPTETTIWSMTGRFEGLDQLVSLKEAIDNTTVYILDEHLNPVPAGVAGTLYIGGLGLARGYLNKPGLTAASFVPDPFSIESGSRMYNTGDLARIYNNTIEILGRTDFQVKIRGYRIELTEIESALNYCPGLKEAVVTTYEDAMGEKKLVAYYLLDTDPGPSQQEIRAHLKNQLPDYMIPADFVALDSFPLTSNKKVDRKALPAPQKEPAASPQGEPENELENKIASLWQELLQVEKIGIHDNFFDLGGHSLLVTRMRSRLHAIAGFDVPVVTLFQYPTVHSLAGYLHLQNNGDADTHSEQIQTGRPHKKTDTAVEPIAIIGMAGRFPGAADVEQFWDNLIHGVEAIRYFSDGELRKAGVDPALLDNPDYVKAGAVLDGIEMFDIDFFGFSPREALLTDPQHRLFQEGAWEALEDAGYRSGRQAKRVGIFAGIGFNHYLLKNIYPNINSLGIADDYQIFIGNDKDFVPTKVSYQLNLSGPSVNVQTACSSSLVAVHLACQSLLNDEADVSLAGGISINLEQKLGYLYQPGGIPSRDGHCRAFDAEANGTIRGSGMGIVVLKRLSKALQDRDHIYAVIKGSAVNNDGADKVGYTAPGINGQTQVIREALAQAGVHPEQISYVEAHGTGTKLGDPVEISALTQAYNSSTPKKQYCAIGSVKTNIGHLDTAAGVVGLIKTALALYHKEIPASLNYSKPHPDIDFAATPFYVNSQLRDWHNSGSPRLAGVSSFGIGGTNAHVILGEAPLKAAHESRRSYQILPVSAKTETALKTALTNLAAHLEKKADLDLADAAYTLATGRHYFNYRAVLVSNSAKNAATLLAREEQTIINVGEADADKKRLIFMFPGQGPEYDQMARELYEIEAVFKKHVDTCAETLMSHLQADLRDYLFTANEAAADNGGGSNQAVQIDAALFTIEYALSRLLMDWGIKPAALLGQGLGEYTAAALAGVFSLEDALSLVITRAKLIGKTEPGSLLSVNLTEQEVEKFLAEDIWLSAVNGPSLCVLAGRPSAITKLRQQLTDVEIPCRILNTSRAYHSPLLHSAARDLKTIMSGISLKPPQIPFIANVTGDWIRPEQATDPAYWANQLEKQARFKEGVEKVLSSTDYILLEVGPGRSLQSLIKQHNARNKRQIMLGTMPSSHSGQTDIQFLFSTLGSLWQQGMEINWQAFYSTEKRSRIPLPTYPFERKKYWIERGNKAGASANANSNTGKKQDPVQWFYTPLWKQSLACAPLDREALTATPQNWLFIGRGAPLEKAMEEILREAGQTVVTAAAGDNYSMVVENSYTIGPVTVNHYISLFKDLKENGRLPHNIVHCLNLTGQEAAGAPSEAIDINAAVHSLVYIAQALEKNMTQEPVTISVISDNMHKICGETVLYPGKSLLLGPCTVIPQEYPDVNCRSIDISDTKPENSHTAAAELLAEILSSREEPLVAYRSDTRWVQTYENISRDNFENTPNRLREHGVYLITGGTGGIGLHMAEYLSREVQANLVLLNASGFIARDEWDTWLQEHTDRNTTSIKIKRIRAMEEKGAQVLLLKADVTDRNQMEKALRTTKEKFKAIHGVIHAAGLPGSGIIGLKQPAAVEKVLAPKVQGTIVLTSLCKQEKLDFFLLCSSITAIAGGFGQVDYCAANAFMDAWAGCNPLGQETWYTSINWERWKDTGMAALPVIGGRSAGTPDPTPQDSTAHLLLGECISETEAKIVYSSRFDPDRFWVLSEHLIAGYPTVPGTAYLEMARKAFEKQSRDQDTVITDVTFLNPLIVKKGSRRDVLTILEKKGANYVFRIVSKIGATDDKSEWTDHARGILSAQGVNTRKQHQIAGIKAQLNPLDVEQLLDEIEHKEFLAVGPRWKILKTIHKGPQAALMFLELPNGADEDLNDFKLHPSILDVATGSIQLIARGNFLPLSYERLTLKQPLRKRVYSYLKYPGLTLEDADILTCDVIITDEAGNELVTVKNFSMKRIKDEMIADLKRNLAALPPTAGDNSGASGAVLGSAFEKIVSGNDEFSILPQEGIKAFKYLLSGRRLSRYIVSPVEPALKIEYSKKLTVHNILKELESLEYPTITHERPDIKNPYMAPGNETEERITKIWQKVLGINRIGIHDNFFELGGTSLTGVQIISELKQEFNTDISTVSIFEAPTIRALSDYLNPQKKPEEAFAKNQGRAEKKKKSLARQKNTIRKR